MPDLIEGAVKVLRDGGLVAIPTETVYGLAADADNVDAVNLIFSTKGRPAGHPLIVHIAKPNQSIAHLTNQDIDQAWQNILSHWSRDVSPAALTLAKAFWPGPLTMILPKAKNVIPEVTGGQETIGIRCPNHPLAQALLNTFGGGLAAPSANRFGRISPTTAQHVREEFSDTVMVLDGGSCEVGIESTIVDLSRWDTHGPVILRPGAISHQMVNDALSKAGVIVPKLAAELFNDSAPRVSGSLSAHYAPKTKMVLYEKAQLDDLLKTHAPLTAKIAWVHFKDESLIPERLKSYALTEIILPDSVQLLAQQLYALLRQLDQSNYDVIAFECLPKGDAWDALRDRLGRAAVGSGTI
jgi:L-threonylcarbamoyladenylate synthase